MYINRVIVKKNIQALSVVSQQMIIKTEKLKPTYRYLYLLGSKKEKKAMLEDLKYEHLDYPKGNNKNYECIDIDMKIQPELFSF